MLNIGIDAWIIQDGNYGDFTVGQRSKFALEFGAMNTLSPSTVGPVRAEHVAASRYVVRARAVFVHPDVWVIDAGSFLAYRSSAPPGGLHVGALVEGEVYVGVDPFFYFERLHEIAGMPRLSYRWHIRDIHRETTPWREEKLVDGRSMHSRDKAQESWVRVSQTDAWGDDGGNGHYVLVCAREGGPEPP